MLQYQVNVAGLCALAKEGSRLISDATHLYRRLDVHGDKSWSGHTVDLLCSVCSCHVLVVQCQSGAPDR